MGMIGLSSSSHDKSCSIFSHWRSASSFDIKLKPAKKMIIPDPSPENYTILRHLNINRFLIIELKYDDFSNYEGRKILVFENITLEELTDQKYIDPHFSENKDFHSPIIRLEPTDRGWEMAKTFCNTIPEK